MANPSTSLVRKSDLSKKAEARAVSLELGLFPVMSPTAEMENETVDVFQNNCFGRDLAQAQNIDVYMLDAGIRCSSPTLRATIASDVIPIDINDREFIEDIYCRIRNRGIRYNQLTERAIRDGYLLPLENCLSNIPQPQAQSQPATNTNIDTMLMTSPSPLKTLTTTLMPEIDIEAFYYAYCTNRERPFNKSMHDRENRENRGGRPTNKSIHDLKTSPGIVQMGTGAIGFDLERSPKSDEPIYICFFQHNYGAWFVNVSSVSGDGWNPEVDIRSTLIDYLEEIMKTDIPLVCLDDGDIETLRTLSNSNFGSLQGHVVNLEGCSKNREIKMNELSTRVFEFDSMRWILRTDSYRLGAIDPFNPTATSYGAEWKLRMEQMAYMALRAAIALGVYTMLQRQQKTT
jgi:hypothetical protein